MRTNGTMETMELKDALPGPAGNLVEDIGTLGTFRMP